MIKYYNIGQNKSDIVLIKKGSFLYNKVIELLDRIFSPVVVENNKNDFAPRHVRLSLGSRTKPVAHSHLYFVSSNAKHK